MPPTRSASSKPKAGASLKASSSTAMALDLVEQRDNADMDIDEGGEAVGDVVEEKVAEAERKGKGAATKGKGRHVRGVKTSSESTEKAAEDGMDVDGMNVDETVQKNGAKATAERKAVVPRLKRGAKRAAENDKEQPEEHDDTKRTRSTSRKPFATKPLTTSSTSPATKPVPKEKPPPFNALATAPEHSRPPRLPFIWGNGDMGQFGLGTDALTDISRPRLHRFFNDSMGQGILGGPGAGIEMATCGGMHSLVVDEAGRVWSFGINDNAALGRPTAGVPDPANPGQIIDAEELETQPMVVEGLVTEGFRVVDVAAGDSISVALGEDGSLRCWGSFRSSDGLLGFDPFEGGQIRFQPSAIPLLRKEKFTGIACGTDHVVALTTDGKVFLWGNGQQAQLGRKIIERRKINALRPERLQLKKIRVVGSGHYHSFAVDHNGVLYSWGLNNMKQTGVDFEDGGDGDVVETPTVVRALHPSNLGGERVIQISAGEHHSLFLISDGRVYSCGRADGGQLGIGPVEPAGAANGDIPMDGNEETAESGTRSYVPTPTLISFPPPPTDDQHSPPIPPGPPAIPPINPMVRISAGTRYSLAVSRAGHLYSWGFGNQCQLGLGLDIETADQPQRVRWSGCDEWEVLDCSGGGQHSMLVAKKRGDKEEMTNGTMLKGG